MPGRNLEQLVTNSWAARINTIEEPVRFGEFIPQWGNQAPTGLQSLVTFPMSGNISNRLFSTIPMETTRNLSWINNYDIKFTYDLNDYTHKKSRQMEIE